MSKKITTASLKRKKALRESVLFPAEHFEGPIAEAENKLQTAHLMDSGVNEAEAHLETLIEEAKQHEDSIFFEFRGIGRLAYGDLIRLHGPTAEQKEKDPTASWNPDTFAPALCAASCDNTDLSEDEFRRSIFESPDWGPGELNRLFNAALKCNTTSKVVELGN